MIENKKLVPWFADFVNYLVARVLPLEFSYQQKKRFFAQLKRYYWEELILYKHCVHQVIRRCVPEEEMMESILSHCHTLAYGGNFRGYRIASKVLQSGFYWPTLFKDALQFVFTCDKFQRMWSISKRNESPLQPILEVELFDIRGMDFMCSFPLSFSNLYILLVVDYVSKLVEAYLPELMIPKW